MMATSEVKAIPGRNACQIKNKISPHSCYNAIIKEMRGKAGEDVEKREPRYPVCRNINWHRHDGKQYGGSSKNLKIELPYHPAIPLLGIYPKKTKTLI